MYVGDIYPDITYGDPAQCAFPSSDSFYRDPSSSDACPLPSGGTAYLALRGGVNRQPQQEQQEEEWPRGPRWLEEQGRGRAGDSHGAGESRAVAGPILGTLVLALAAHTHPSLPPTATHRPTPPGPHLQTHSLRLGTPSGESLGTRLSKGLGCGRTGTLWGRRQRSRACTCSTGAGGGAGGGAGARGTPRGACTWTTQRQ